MEYVCRRLDQRTVVVTGGASGIGEATALRCLREGANVVVGDINISDIERVAARVDALGMLDRFDFVPCDVSEEHDVVRLIHHAVERFGRIDCLANIAGTGGAFSPLWETSIRDWDRTQQVNLRGAYLAIKHAARAMIDGGHGGSITNVSSLAAKMGGGAGPAYVASKAAVIALTRSAAAEFGKHHIRCNVVVPGAIISPLVHRNINPEQMKELGARMQPIPLAGDPDMVAPMFAFLASDDARFISGQTLVVDGGASTSQDGLTQMHSWGRELLEGLDKTDDEPTETDQVNRADACLELLNLEAVSVDETAARGPMRTVVVTGATKGLGYELCRGFQQLGHRVIGCARNAEMVEKLRKEFGPRHAFFPVDVSDEQQVRAWAEAVIKQYGPPDLILNNAAVNHDAKQTWRFSHAEFEKVLRVNLLGTVNVIRHFLPPMIRRMSGIVVNFSSGWGRGASARGAPYCASKWAIEGLTKAMALELPTKMAVVSLHPGIVRTETMQLAFGESAQLYPTPSEWAKVAVPFLLGIRPEDNGRQLSVPGMTAFRGLGRLSHSAIRREQE